MERVHLQMDVCQAFCDSNTCAAKKNNGASCSSSDGCVSGYCETSSCKAKTALGVLVQKTMDASRDIAPTQHVKFTVL